MRHAIGLAVVLLLLARGAALAAGNSGPPCRIVSWVATGNMTTSRHGHAATLLPSGKVLVSGGLPGVATDVDTRLATAELYDPVTGTWSPTASMTFPRVYHTMTLLPTGKVLAAGGDWSRDPKPAELYDPDTGQWTTTGTMLLEHEQHTATLLPTGKVLVVGGLRGFGPPLASAELYDPATGEWLNTGSPSVIRVYHTVTLLASGQVLVLGGLFGFEGRSDSAELYDPATGTWTPAAPMLAGRYLHTATRLPSDAVLVAGGVVVHSSGETFAEDEAELYDPMTGSWRQTGSLFTPHAAHTATLLPSGKVLVVDGAGIGVLLANTELFDPESETWTDAGCTAEIRASHTATLLRSGLVLVAGGSGDSSAELYGIIVSPAQVSLATGASQTFTAKGGSDLGYVWSFMQNESGGTLTASGDYRAGPVGGVTDVVQVVDSFANSSTATVSVLRRTAAVSATAPQAKSMGCGTTGGAGLPALGGAVLLLLGWRSLTVRPRPTP